MSLSVASPSPKKITRFNKRGSMASPNMRVVKNMIPTFNKELGYDALTPNVGMKAPIKTQNTSVSALKTQK